MRMLAKDLIDDLDRTLFPGKGDRQGRQGRASSGSTTGCSSIQP
jgi:hypothetical protein